MKISINQDFALIKVFLLIEVPDYWVFYLKFSTNIPRIHFCSTELPVHAVDFWKYI